MSLLYFLSRLLVSRDEFGEMPVHIAARQGHMHMLSFILELCPGAARYILGFYITRLLERLAPIFYLNCEHVLFVYILKQRRKIFCGFLKKQLADFKEFKFFYKIKNLQNTFFFIFIIHKPSLWSRDVPQKIWARSVQPF